VSEPAALDIKEGKVGSTFEQERGADQCATCRQRTWVGQAMTMGSSSSSRSKHHRG
jgi:hypothetical protein